MIYVSFISGTTDQVATEYAYALFVSNLEHLDIS